MIQNSQHIQISEHSTEGQAPVDIREILQQAIEHHKAGRFDQARSLFEIVLSSEPSNPTALHALALMACREGQYEQAINLVEKAIASK